jgi:hypothetical protein
MTIFLQALRDRRDQLAAMSLFDAKARFHRPSLISATGCAPTWSSVLRNARPRIGRTA